MDRRIVAGILLAALVIFMIAFSRSNESAKARSVASNASSASDPVASGFAPVVVPLPTLAASDRDAPASAFATFSWGTGGDQLGHLRRQEGNAEAPMSFVVTANGATILDQTNKRLIVLGPDGKPRSEIKLGQDGAQDVAVAKDGTTAVLDRLADRRVDIFGPDGKPRASYDLEGKGIKEGGGTTGVFIDGDKVYVEREHGPLVLLGDTNGKASTDRDEIPGRPSRDGTLYLSSGITSKPEGRIWVSAITRATNAHKFTRELRLAVPLTTMLLLDSDMRATIYVAVEAMPNEGQTFVVLSCLDESDGHLLGSVQVPSNTLPDETFRDFSVLEAGGVLHAEMTESGVAYRKYDCR